MRDKVSYRFFEKIYRDGLLKIQRGRKMYRGFYLYAIDGDQFELPASQNILDHGYRGYPTGPNQETHYPKMYTAQVYDLVNHVVSDFGCSTEIDEVHLARQMCSKLEKNSITIYDRLHCGYDSFYAHEEHGSFFLVRARARHPGANRDVIDFASSRQRSGTVCWRSRNEKRLKADLHLRLVKVKNPRTGEDMVFVTNLPPEIFTRREIGKLYRRRWDIEVSFRDLTCTLKLGQWHSKKVNGVLQEIYALLWLVNSIKTQMQEILQTALAWFDDVYRKSNLKICVAVTLDHLNLLVRRRDVSFYRILNFWLLKTVETRRRNSRSHPRVTRTRRTLFPTASLVHRRPR